MNSFHAIPGPDPWREEPQPALASVRIGGRVVAPGARVRIQPSRMADIMDLALAGQIGIIEAIEQDLEGRVQVALVIEADPGRDLGERRQVGHRFFFAPEELAPAPGPEVPAETPTDAPRILLVGIGNVFFGDDGFGVALARRLARQSWPEGVEIRDFGIRGYDLALALLEPWTHVVLLDASPRGEAPGCVSWVEVPPQPPRPPDAVPAAANPHGLTPAEVLRFAAEVGTPPASIWLLACEPAAWESVAPEAGEEFALSPPVAAALPAAADLVRRRVDQWIAEGCNGRTK